MTKPARPLVAATSLALALAACASTIDPDVPLLTPDSDWVVGVSGGVIWDESEPLDQGEGLGGVDVGWLDGVWGLHAGVRLHGEGTRSRVGLLAEATAWYGVILGLGTRVGFATSGPVGPAVDLTLLLALPIPIIQDCADREWTVLLVPYARPGFRLTGGDADADDVRGVHELGVSVRFTTFGF
ncbi:MAG: hypothetical protein IT385_22795 [Deltaproteobacteria bacterium]|nr:hypothetical protein [Deltaproteobacteria bacterium]